MVAHSDPTLCATVTELLGREGIDSLICHEGNEALKVMEKTPPVVAIMDVALPGLYAFEVVEKVRQRPGLGDVKIILLSSVYNRTAYKRTPSSLYGADDYIEKHHISKDLVSKILRLAGVTRRASVAGPEDSPKLSSADVNDRLRQAEEGEVHADLPAEALEKARRLARIIVSDIALYNQEKIDQGVRKGNLQELLDFEISEGRRLFQERIPESIRKTEDFLASALNNLIESRRREIFG